MKVKKLPNARHLSLKILSISITLVVTCLTPHKIFAQHTPWLTPQASQIVKNPVAATPETIAAGKSLYVTNCSPCHGLKGKGDGAAAQALATKPADHTSAKVQSESDGALFWKLTVGRAPMPGYKALLTDQQRWELVDYIRTLAKK